jgi:hypothetical protein
MPYSADVTESQLWLVPVTHLHLVLHDTMKLLRPAIERSNGRWTVEDVMATLFAGQSQLWLSVRDGKPEAALVGKIVNYPRMNVYFVHFLGGCGMRKWYRLLPEIERWAKLHGCSELDMMGRKGFLRALKDWSPSWVCMRKPI